MKLALVACLHGNERYGIEVINHFKNKIPFFIGNPKAVIRNCRFIDSDLNRVFPGKKDGDLEEKRALDLMNKIDDYEYILDLHSSSNDCPLFGIVTKPSKGKINFAKKLGLRRLVLMPKSFASGKSLIDFCKCGVSLEVGPHGRKENSREVIELINNLIYGEISNKNLEIFEVFKVIKKEYKFIRIKNFQEVRENQILSEDKRGFQLSREAFVPILVGEEAYKDVLCLAARKVNLKDVESLI